jgi:hypothetical protein
VKRDFEKIRSNRSSDDVEKKSSGRGFFAWKYRVILAMARDVRGFCQTVVHDFKNTRTNSKDLFLFEIHVVILRHLWTPSTGGIGCLEVGELSWNFCPIWTSKDCCNPRQYQYQRQYC